MRIRTVKLSKIAKSPLTYIAIAAAIAAFAIGLFVSAQTPAIVADPNEGMRVERTVVPSKIGRPGPDGALIWTEVPTPPTGLGDDYNPIMEPDAIGIATMGKLLYLFGGGSVQLPADVYVKDFLLLPEPCSGSGCPEHPVAVLGRGDDWVAIGRHGKPIPGWSNSPAYNPDRFKFLSE